MFKRLSKTEVFRGYNTGINRVPTVKKDFNLKRISTNVKSRIITVRRFSRSDIDNRIL